MSAIDWREHGYPDWAARQANAEVDRAYTPFHARKRPVPADALIDVILANGACDYGVPARRLVWDHEPDYFGRVLFFRPTASQLPRDEVVTQLGEALLAASDHLDYCGYGDKWERECAEASGLGDKIATALARIEMTAA